MAKTRFGVYPTYLFKDHDPILDQISTMRGDRKLTSTQIEAISGVSKTTLNSWEKRKTKRPQLATVAAVVKSLGGELLVVYKGTKINNT